jgi:hypothetical protein
MAKDVVNWRWVRGTPPSDAESVAIVRVSVLVAHSLQTPRWRASLSSRSTTSTMPRPIAEGLDVRGKLILVARRYLGFVNASRSGRIRSLHSAPLMGGWATSVACTGSSVPAYDCRRGGLRSIVGTEWPSTPRFASMSTMSSWRGCPSVSRYSVSALRSRSYFAMSRLSGYCTITR